MGRTMPTECPHGRIQDWGDFGCDNCWEGVCVDGHHNDPEPCAVCDQLSANRSVPSPTEETDSQIPAWRFDLVKAALERWCNWQERLLEVLGPDQYSRIQSLMSADGWVCEPFCPHKPDTRLVSAVLDEVVRRRNMFVAGWYQVIEEIRDERWTPGHSLVTGPESQGCSHATSSLFGQGGDQP